MLQDRALERLQLGARLETQILGEGAVRRAVRVQRVRLSARSVERQHELPAQPLSERVLADEILELADELGVAPDREVGVDAGLDGGEPQPVQAGDVRLGERLVGEVGQRLAAPQRQGVAQHLGRVAGVGGPRCLQEIAEARDVELARLDVEDVAGRTRREPVRAEVLA